MRRTVITTGAVVVVLATALVGATPIQADETPTADLEIGAPPPCGDEEAATLSAVDCAAETEPVDSIGPIAPEISAAAAQTARVETALVATQGPGALRKNCRLHAEVPFYTDSDWNRLGQNLAAEASHCADYYISLPAIAGNKTMPRPDQAWRIRALGPRFHAMAEAHLTSWQTWVTTNRKTWVEAGREFRKRMAAAGYDVALGDLWAVNEVPSSVRQGTGQSRRNLLDFLNGLYEGDGTATPTKGLVFVVGLGQRTQNLSVYKTNLRGWLSDSAFWSEADGYVRFWAQETYGDIRAWGVPDTPRMTRAAYLTQYLMHPLELARAGGDQSAAALAFLTRDLPPARERGVEVAVGVRLHRRRPPPDAPLPLGAGPRDQTRRGHEPGRGPRGTARVRMGAGGTWRDRLRGQDGGPAGAARLCARERLRAGRELAARRVRPSGRARLVRGHLRRCRIQRRLGCVLDVGVSSPEAGQAERPAPPPTATTRRS